MARYNEILVGRINRGLQKYTAIKGEAPAPQLATEIMAVLPLPIGLEYRWLDGWARYAINVTQAAVAAQFTFIQIRNPKASGAIAVIERVALLTGATAVGYGPQPNDLTTPVPNPMRLDARIGLNTRSGMVVSTSTNASGNFPAAVAGIWQGPAAALDVITGDFQELPLLPGDALVVSPFAVNTAQSLSFWWRERPFEESEGSIGVTAGG